MSFVRRRDLKECEKVSEKWNNEQKSLGEKHARSTDEKDRSQSWKGGHGKFMITLTDLGKDCGLHSNSNEKPFL